MLRALRPRIQPRLQRAVARRDVRLDRPGKEEHVLRDDREAAAEIARAPRAHVLAEDADRPLTEKGEKQARDVAKGLQAKGIRIDTLLTSPLVRAKQTAEILVKNWDGKAPEIVFCDELIPDVRPKKLAKRLRQIAAERVGLIGHNPQLRYFGSWLIGSKRAQLNLTKAGVAYIPVSYTHLTLPTNREV